MTTFKHRSGLTEPDKKVLPMSSDICYPSLRYVHSQRERETEVGELRMSAATETIIDQTRPRVISLRWIINAREDLIWFIGSVASSYALLILYVTGILLLIPMVAGSAILIDAPHVFR